MSTPNRGSLRPSPRSPLFSSTDKPTSRGHLTPKAVKQPSGQESRGKWSASGQVEIQSNPCTPRGTERISELKKELVDMRLALGKQAEALKLANKQIKEKDQTLNDLQSAKSALESELIRLRLQLPPAFKPNSKESAEKVWEKEQEIQQLKAELEDVKGKVMAKTDFLYTMIQNTHKSGSVNLSAACEDLYESACLARFELEGLQCLLSHMREEQEFRLEVLESRRLVQKQCSGVEELRQEVRTVGQLVSEVKEELTKVYFENCRIHWHREVSKV